MTIHVVLFRGQGLISALIRWQTRGEFSHAALLIDGDLYEAWQGVGVRIKRAWLQPTDGSVVLFDVMATSSESAAIYRYCQRQLGKGYDYLGVLRFITRNRSGDQRRLFCSELVFDAFKAAEHDLFNECQGWEVPPDRLKWSPLLKRR